MDNHKKTSFVEPESDTQSLHRDLLSGKEVIFAYPGMSKYKLSKLSEVFLSLLKHFDLCIIHKTLMVVFEEIISNHVKGCAKRIFFNQSGKHIQSRQDYNKAMLAFTNQVILNWQDFCEKNADNNQYYIECSLRLQGDYIECHFKSNYELIDWEMERIQERQAAFNNKSTIDIAYEDIGDKEEGGGLGVFMILRLLDTVGISQDSYEIYRQNGCTHTKFRIPQKMDRQQIHQALHT